jgi:hypothetical protein
MVVMLAFAVLAAAAALGPAQFPDRPGWYAGAGRVHACPGVPSSRCASATSWAATVRWRDCIGCLPHRTADALGPEDVAIQVTFARERPMPAWVKPMSWPPLLRPIAGIEGLPNRIGVVQLIGRVRGFEAFVWVFFGRTHPTARQVERARAELRAARLPAP